MNSGQNAIIKAKILIFTYPPPLFCGFGLGRIVGVLMGVGVALPSGVAVGSPAPEVMFLQIFALSSRMPAMVGSLAKDDLRISLIRFTASVQ